MEARLTEKPFQEAAYVFIPLLRPIDLVDGIGHTVVNFLSNLEQTYLI